MSDKITCQICGAPCHAIARHLEQSHAGVTLDQYKADYPDAPLLSDAAKQRIHQARLSKEKSVTSEPTPSVAAEAPVTSGDGEPVAVMRPLHEVFDLGPVPAAMTPTGKPIMVEVFQPGHKHQKWVPKIDKGFIFNIELLKTAMMALAIKGPLYTWGHTGCGKTTLQEQIAAYTNRPQIRMQHTMNMEEAHVIGQWVLRAGETKFMPGWLPLAMRYGWYYLADEYDFATPGVLSAYQAVLEGKPLVIKDADEEWRITEPHPNFRIGGTGNTNGTGDETGLYQGTQIQNAANYDRWAVVEKVEFLDEATETKIIQTRTGLHKKDADLMAKFAKMVRGDQSVSMPISPRSLIRAAQLGRMKGCYKKGLALAYINRLPATERETASQLAQRVFG